MRFPVYHQLESMDCGPTCIQMIASYYKKYYTSQKLKQLCNLTRIGISLQDILVGCEAIGLRAISVQPSLDEVQRMPLPAILYWRQEHYVVLYQIVRKGKRVFYYIADPAYGKIRLEENLFIKEWQGNRECGIGIVIAPMEAFYRMSPEKETVLGEIKRIGVSFKKFLTKHRKQLAFVFILSFLAMATTWIMPFLFQKTIDEGIKNKDLSLVVLLILGQFAFFIGYTISNNLANLILTKMGFKIGLEFLTRYLNKLINLPISFFDVKLNTDLIQRMDDQIRIETFLTKSLNSTIFALINFFVFSFILLYYNHVIFIIYIVFITISALYSNFFLKKRRAIDYSRFSANAENKNRIYELINGMPDIKINSAQQTKVKQWEITQKTINKISLKSLYLNYCISAGTAFFDKLKDIAITAGCAYLVIDNNMTIGVMMTVTYILGQLSGSTSQIIAFFQIAEDTKLAYERLNEIYQKEDECSEEKIMPPQIVRSGIKFDRVSFKYEGNISPYVLQDVSICIPKGKITAIVGCSGSGKTTLLKLMLSFYGPQVGSVMLDDQKMSKINADEWRKKCGVVMQDGFIFSGTITDNIAISDLNPDLEEIKKAVQIACIDEFIERLPMKFDTKIGRVGINLSGGQQQRLLIARAVYKNPEFIFFDEATSSLDANNEHRIIDNLYEYYKEKTVVIIAHRLSTVRNADNIIFLDKGKVVEQGTHQFLSQKKGAYFQLVKNQLELNGGAATST